MEYDDNAVKKTSDDVDTVENTSGDIEKIEKTSGNLETIENTPNVVETVTETCKGINELKLSEEDYDKLAELTSECASNAFSIKEHTAEIQNIFKSAEDGNIKLIVDDMEINNIEVAPNDNALYIIFGIEHYSYVVMRTVDDKITFLTENKEFQKNVTEVDRKHILELYETESARVEPFPFDNKIKCISLSEDELKQVIPTQRHPVLFPTREQRLKNTLSRIMHKGRERLVIPKSIYDYVRKNNTIPAQFSQVVIAGIISEWNLRNIDTNIVFKKK